MAILVEKATLVESPYIFFVCAGHHAACRLIKVNGRNNHIFLITYVSHARGGLITHGREIATEHGDQIKSNHMGNTVIVTAR